MKRILNFAVVFSTLFMFSSCAALRGPDFSRIQLGMNKEDLRITLNVRSDNIVSAERDPFNNSLLEIVQYYWVGERYWFYFINNRLDKWHIIRDTINRSEIKADVHVKEN